MCNSKMSEYVAMNFDEDQLVQIKLGLDQNLDISVYADIEYLAPKMQQIRLGLEEGLDISAYALKEFDWLQMEEIRKGLENNLNVYLYNDPIFDCFSMRQVREGLKEGICILAFLDKGYRGKMLRQIRFFLEAGLEPEPYLKDNYDAEQLEEIRLAGKRGISIVDYINPSFYGAQIHEIAEGLAAKIDVSVYASGEYIWQQMREIRLGLEKRLDVSWYAKPLFLWQQMREIRLGLEDGLDVGGYAKLICGLQDMIKAREKMLAEREEIEKQLSSVPLEIHHDQELLGEIIVNSNGMNVSLILQKPKFQSYTIQKVVNYLHTFGVIAGVRTDIIKEMLLSGRYDQEICVAVGTMPVNGKDGHYQFHFKLEMLRLPKLLPDGSVDYKNIDFYEEVLEGDLIATYEPPTKGTEGYTVYGKKLLPIPGRELPVLKGNGFRVSEDGKNYYATKTGRIEYKNGILEITDLYIVNGNATSSGGNIRFNGSIHIKGNIEAGVEIEVTKDIIVDGNVGAAKLKSGNDILIRNGLQAAGIASLTAEGKIISKFLESGRLYAGSDIQANYIMNCDVTCGGKVSISGFKGGIYGVR